MSERKKKPPKRNFNEMTDTEEKNGTPDLTNEGKKEKFRKKCCSLYVYDTDKKKRSEKERALQKCM